MTPKQPVEASSVEQTWVFEDAENGTKINVKATFHRDAVTFALEENFAFAFEVYEGTPRLIVWADKDIDEPTANIDLSNAVGLLTEEIEDVDD